MASNDINITRGDTLNLHVELADANGSEWPLAKGDTIAWTVKKTTHDKKALISKTGQDVTILPADTSSLEYGGYVYDVQLTTAEGEVHTVVKPSAFNVCEEVTF